MHLLLVPFGVVWLWFWVRGLWFAALPVTFLVFAWGGQVNPIFRAAWLVLPWVPFGVRWMWFRRETAPVAAFHPYRMQK